MEVTSYESENSQGSGFFCRVMEEPNLTITVEKDRSDDCCLVRSQPTYRSE